MSFMDYRCFELTGLPLHNPPSNFFETELGLSVRTARRAVLGRLGTGVRTNQRYFIISKY